MLTVPTACGFIILLKMKNRENLGLAYGPDLTAFTRFQEAVNKWQGIMCAQNKRRQVTMSCFPD